jgi:Tfp pilus assembly protein PilN
LIRVNLVGGSRKKLSKGAKAAGPTSLLPILLVLIVIGTAAGGYFWYSSLATQAADLQTKIAQQTAQKAQLEKVIEQDRIYEGRKKELENRIKIIEGLKRNQVSPVVSLDALGDAIDRTQFVWLSNVDQNNTTFSMSGIGTSVNALADFVSNLEGTGYFRNINLQNAQDSAGNFTFSMTCEFSPPKQLGAAAAPPAPTGAN